VYSLHKFKIRVEKPFLTFDFTGKFVKTLLMNANPSFTDVFENPSYPTPKPIRVTSLLRGNEKFPMQAIYPKTFNKDRKVFPVEIKGEYYFLVGINSDLNRELQIAIANLFAGVNFKYGNFDVSVKATGYEQMDVSFPTNYNSLYIKFITPSFFRDPFSRIAGVKEEKVRRFAPIPPFIFSLNVYELLRQKYTKTVVRLGYAFYESHNNLETVKRIWYSYDGKLLPGVVGYAKFFRKEKVKSEALDDFVKILTHAQIMGVGTGRANGFGYVIVEVK